MMFRRKPRRVDESMMKASVTSVTGAVYDVALEFDGVTEDGITVFLGRVPVPIGELASFNVDVLPARTEVRFECTA